MNFINENRSNKKGNDIVSITTMNVYNNNFSPAHSYKNRVSDMDKKNKQSIYSMDN